MTHTGYETPQFRTLLEEDGFFSRNNLENPGPGLLDTLGPLQVIEGRSARRNKFVEQYTWVPGGKREVTLAAHRTGPAGVLHRDYFSPKNRSLAPENQLRAPEEDYKRMLEFKRQSKVAIRQLDRAVIARIEEWEWDADFIKDSPQLTGILTEYVTNKRQLDAFDWPRGNAKILESAREQISDQIVAMSPAQIKVLAEIVRDSHLQRRTYWGRQIETLQAENLIVQNIEAKWATPQV